MCALVARAAQVLFKQGLAPCVFPRASDHEFFAARPVTCCSPINSMFCFVPRSAVVIACPARESAATSVAWCPGMKRAGRPRAMTPRARAEHNIACV